MQLQIIKPCKKNWDNMLPAANGRHCDTCHKTVIDFEGWEADEIKAYLIQNAGKQVCGRLNTRLLHIRPQNKKGRSSYVNKIAAAFLFYFGLLTSACRTNENITYGGKWQDGNMASDTADAVLTVNNSYILGGFGLDTLIVNDTSKTISEKSPSTDTIR